MLILSNQESQKDLRNKTSETLTQVVEGNEEAIKVQTELNMQQTSLKEAIRENIDKLSQEKQVIEGRQKEIKKHSTEVRKDLGNVGLRNKSCSVLLFYFRSV